MIKKLLFIPVILVFTLGVGTGFDSKEDLASLAESDVVEEDLLFSVPYRDEAELDDQYFSDYLFLGKSYLGFREALAFKESQGRYDIVNSYGYMGKYQFSKNTLRMMGLKNTDDFLRNSKKQEAAFHAYISFNKWVLRKEISNFSGKEINGVRVTESGILAAAHLAGPGNVKKFLNTQGSLDFSDANGATVRYYLKKFSDYDTSRIVANKKPRLM